MGELGERSHAVVSGELRGRRDGQHGGQPIAPSAPAPELRNRVQTLEQAAHTIRAQRHRLAFASPVRGIVEGAKLLARVGHQGVNENLLRSTVGGPRHRHPGVARESLRAPQRLPVRRPVARASEAAGIDERLGEQSRMSMDLSHVAREPTHALSQRPRSEVHRPLRLGQDHEPGVVRNQMQAPELLLGQPPDPLIARPQLERPGLPADEREPALAQHRDVSHAAPHEGAKGQVVMGAHQLVPALALRCTHGRTHRHLAQSLGNRAEHRLDLVPAADARVWRARNRLSSHTFSISDSIG